MPRSRLIFSIALCLSIIGAFCWFNMPREEDPRISEKYGIAVCVFPGADISQIELLLAKPIERELAGVSNIKKVRSTLRAGSALFVIHLKASVTDTTAAWQKVRRVLSRVEAKLPPGAHPPSLRHDILDTESVLLAVTGPVSQLQLDDAAKVLKRRLLDLPNVSKVTLSGAANPQIYVEYDEPEAQRLNLSPAVLGQTLAQRNVTTPGGSIAVNGISLALRPHGEFESLEELRQTPILLPSGAAVPLDSVARVRRGPMEPTQERARFNGQSSIVVGVVPTSPIDVVELGIEIREQIEIFRRAHTELQISEIAFQPDQVKTRLGDLGLSLLSGAAIIGAVVFLTMGRRLGLVVSSVVPLVALASVCIYAIGGGVLHQIAIAALVLALGLLVDNAIVVAESVQRKIDHGKPPDKAVKETVRELAVPLLSSTGTTVAAFLPMFLAEGGTADFTRAIPLVVSLTLVVSLAYALFVTGTLSGHLLRPAPRVKAGYIERLTERISDLSTRSPKRCLLIAAIVVSISGLTSFRVDRNFFPTSDRLSLVVRLMLPEGRHLETTDEVAHKLEIAIGQHEDVESITTFVGRGTPTFYYNLEQQPTAPHMAEAIVTLKSREAVAQVQAAILKTPERLSLDAQVLVKRLEQGPSLAAPVEVRLYSEDLSDLHVASGQVKSLVRSIHGAIGIRSTGGLGQPTLNYAVNDAAAARLNIARSTIATALLGSTRGTVVSEYRGNADPEPIVIRSSRGDAQEAVEVAAIRVQGAHGMLHSAENVAPIGHLASASLSFQPSTIHHHNRRRTTSVLAEVSTRATHDQVVAELLPLLETTKLPDSVTWEIGGAAETQAEANLAIAEKAGYGILLLVLILLAQFNSFRKVAIVLVTAPLALFGIWPGLWVLQQPFSFIALLGAISLIGIVINAAIVLLDVIDSERARGARVPEAIRHALSVRTRPILLTTLTTVCGLLPLLISSSTLWPPLAAAMISGLMIGTMLSLLVVPALYQLVIVDSPAKVVAQPSLITQPTLIPPPSATQASTA